MVKRNRRRNRRREFNSEARASRGHRCGGKSVRRSLARDRPARVRADHFAGHGHGFIAQQKHRNPRELFGLDKIAFHRLLVLRKERIFSFDCARWLIGVRTSPGARTLMRIPMGA